MRKNSLVVEPMAKLPPPAPLSLKNLKPITFSAPICQDLSDASLKEWLITNGIGGYASSTILGMNTRRTHGLLVASTRPPVGRVVVLSKVEETLVIPPSGRYELSTNRYGEIVHPEGYRYLVEFRLDPWPTFFYRLGEILLIKSVFMLPGENATVIGYTLHSSQGPVELVIRPLVAFRDFRSILKESADFPIQVEEAPGSLTLCPAEGLPPLLIHHTAELVERSPCWYRNFEYLQEEEEGQKVKEDLWSFGQLLYLLKPGESSCLVASTGRKGAAELTFHRRRLENTQAVLAQTIDLAPTGPLATRLSWTAESFLARCLLREQPGYSSETFLLAGFPWFTPWGRDTLIALPGLLLTSKRFDLARSVLQTLVHQMKDSLLPVRLSEEEGSPEYDSADTSLWLFFSVWYFFRATRDLKFIGKHLLDPMRRIIEGHLEGTNFGIKMDEDGLILLSDEELPLTWMDARLPSPRPGVPGRAVTPRWGKPVEINALWANALQVMGNLSEDLGLRRWATYLKLARLVKENFTRRFVSPQGILYDRVTDALKDPSIRPNMLIAASLPFSPVSKSVALQILQTVEEKLLTPVGLRTLSPEDPQYRGRYVGDLTQRALSYHQGTVWPWLIGPYVSTVLKTRGLTRSTQLKVRKLLAPFLEQLKQGCLGSIGELFDGDPPHLARGGISQAWSLGEILRAIHEARLEDI